MKLMKVNLHLPARQNQDFNCQEKRLKNSVAFRILGLAVCYECILLTKLANFADNVTLVNSH